MLTKVILQIVTLKDAQHYSPVLKNDYVLHQLMLFKQ